MSVMDEGPIPGAGLSLRLDADNRTLLASIAPHPAAVPIDEAWLRQYLADQGYGALSYAPMALTSVLAQYNSGATVSELKLGEKVDAVLSITLSADRLLALLHITPAQGGRPVSKADVLAELADKGVTEGIQLDDINRAIAAGVAEGVVIARGRPPQHGEDGRLQSQLPEVRSRVPRMTETGQIDYRDLGDILTVVPGQLLMQRLPPTAGVDGMNVLGEPIPARAGKEVMYAANLAGSQIDPQDPDRLLSSIAGQPVEVKGGMIVEPVYTVAAVNMTTGNIRFDGSVLVRGDVAAGMSIHATGDIQIGGTADPCILEAGGNIVIKGGALGGLGRKELADAAIRCQGCFNAAYAQQARIEAGDSIFIDDLAMQCELAAGNHIRVGNRKRGHVIGGRALATLSIVARVLGSPNRIATLLEVGISPAMNKRMLELASARDERENQLLEIGKLLVFADRNPTRIDPKMVDRACSTSRKLNAEVKALREEERALADLVSLAQQAVVCAEQAMYDGVTVQMGALRYKVAGEHGSGRIGLLEGVLGLLPDEAVRADRAPG